MRGRGFHGCDEPAAHAADAAASASPPAVGGGQLREKLAAAALQKSRAASLAQAGERKCVWLFPGGGSGQGGNDGAAVAAAAIDSPGAGAGAGGCPPPRCCRAHLQRYLRRGRRRHCCRRHCCRRRSRGPRAGGGTRWRRVGAVHAMGKPSSAVGGSWAAPLPPPALSRSPQPPPSKLPQRTSAALAVAPPRRIASPFRGHAVAAGMAAGTQRPLLPLSPSTHYPPSPAASLGARQARRRRRRPRRRAGARCRRWPRRAARPRPRRYRHCRRRGSRPQRRQPTRSRAGGHYRRGGRI